MVRVVWHREVAARRDGCGGVGLERAAKVQIGSQSGAALRDLLNAQEEELLLRAGAAAGELRVLAQQQREQLGMPAEAQFAHELELVVEQCVHKLRGRCAQRSAAARRQPSSSSRCSCCPVARWLPASASRRRTARPRPACG